MRCRFVRRPTLALVGLLIAYLASPESAWRNEARAADPPSEAFVAVESLPVFSKDGLTALRLKRGQAVTVVDNSPLELGSDFVVIEWTEGEKKQTGTVTIQALSKTKPAAVPAATAPADPKATAAATATTPGATDKPNTGVDRRRLDGTWMIAGLSVLGQINPDPRMSTAGLDAPSMIPAGMRLPPGTPAAVFPSLAGYMPNSHFHRFHDGFLTKWSLWPKVDEKGVVSYEPMFQSQSSFVLDATATPRRLDTFDPRMSVKFRKPATGIYRWEDGDVLVWAVTTTYGGMTPPSMADPAPPRPAGFQPDQLKKATVLYLIRADEKKYPAPAVPKTPAQQQGGNAF